MIQGFGYLFFNSVKDLTNNRFSPSIIAGYGPYNDLQTAITTILSIYNTDINNTNVTLFAPPLGLPFGIISGGKFTEYIYEKGNFEYANTAEGGSSDPGIVPKGSGGSGTITDVVKGKSTDSQPTTLVTNNIAYIPLAEPQVNGLGGTDGLMSASDKSKLNYLIEVLEPGVYNSDSSFEVQGQNSADVTILQGQVNRIIAILGSLYDSNGNDAHFEITE